MIVFNVVQEQYGWSVRMGQRMTTPFRSKQLAIREADRLASGIRRHGQVTEVVVGGDYIPEMSDIESDSWKSTAPALS